MKLPKSDKAIIDTLAFNPLMSIYALCKKTGYSTGTIPQTLRRLESQNLVKRTEKGYVLTFLGLMKCFLNHFEDPNFGNEYIREIVKKYSSLMDYPLFTLYEEFEKWLGEKYYEQYISASYITNRLFETQITIVSTKAPKPIKRGEKVPLKIKPVPLHVLEGLWQHAYALVFFSLIKHMKPSRNPKINKFIKNVYRREIVNRRKQIENLEALMKKLTV